jgi:hypothetical protein
LVRQHFESALEIAQLAFRKHGTEDSGQTNSSADRS